MNAKLNPRFFTSYLVGKCPRAQVHVLALLMSIRTMLTLYFWFFLPCLGLDIARRKSGSFVPAHTGTYLEGWVCNHS